MPGHPEKRGSGLASLAGMWRRQVRFAADFDDLPIDLADALGASRNSSSGDQS
jgi:hypothetical protein